QGMSVLFAGPSGTGKTMAAEALAHTLSLDLFRVDLSRIVDKYIGETEKRLAALFDAADMTDAILLFDEADVLFGRRTEVKDSHDHYANLEVGYLLQRIEAFRGIAVLTTNLANAIDDAFARRFAFSLHFEVPSLDERQRIWRGAFPAGAPASGLDWARLARLT
ncbi:ATP-binding protein, partial [Escherichia coli]|nr:ATP-binding protein [Escherichia coli]